MSETNLRGKSALVTGGGRGIGRATAIELARAGARVVVTARTHKQIMAVAKEIGDVGSDATAVPTDVGKLDDVERLFQAIGPVDILVNSAGIVGPIAPVAAADPSAWVDDIRVNLDGVFFTCHFAVQNMMRAGAGNIINVSSGAAKGSTTGWSAYSAAKAGVEALTKILALEVGSRGVRVNAIRPGIVDTEMQVEIRAAGEDDFGPENVQRFHRYKKEGMLRDPRDPARLILWLLSPAASELNGEILAIDDPEIAAKIGLQPIPR